MIEFDGKQYKSLIVSKNKSTPNGINKSFV